MKALLISLGIVVGIISGGISLNAEELNKVRFSEAFGVGDTFMSAGWRTEGRYRDFSVGCTTNYSNAQNANLIACHYFRLDRDAELKINFIYGATSRITKGTGVGLGFLVDLSKMDDIEIYGMIGNWQNYLQIEANADYCISDGDYRYTDGVKVSICLKVKLN